MKTFEQWLHETKGRTISLLTDEEIGRYATEYGRECVSERPYTFPKLMTDQEGNIVLFTREQVGTVVNLKSRDPLGYHSTTWNMRYFKDYEGTITLSNELITRGK